jgi:trafficking protein particle complex subunit 6
MSKKEKKIAFFPVYHMASFAPEEVSMVSESLFEYLLREILLFSAESVNNIGYQIGFRLAESVAADLQYLGSDPLDMIKFICKDFWLVLFRKKMDKLQTNHRGVFVLSDHSFKWLDRYKVGDQNKANEAAADKMMQFTCSIVRGALANLGLSSIVNGDRDSYPCVNFHIKSKS